MRHSFTPLGSHHIYLTPFTVVRGSEFPITRINPLEIRLCNSGPCQDSLHAWSFSRSLTALFVRSLTATSHFRPPHECRLLTLQVTYISACFFAPFGEVLQARGGVKHAMTRCVS